MEMIMKTTDRNSILILLTFSLTMLGLGISDSLRGIFFPIFQQHYRLSNMQLSYIAAVSYAGNLSFLFLGGKILDRMEKKKALAGLLFIWMAAIGVFAVSDRYVLLLAAMFFAMGASTLLNTTINITSSFLFISAPEIVVNVLFFIQGVGTSLNQSITGNWAKSMRDFRLLSTGLLVLGIAAVVCLSFCIFSQDNAGITGTKREHTTGNETVSRRQILKRPETILFILIFGFYFIAEHGILNWLVSYCTGALDVPMGTASNYLAVFFGGITIGRLILAPLVDRWGIFKSIRIFGALATVFYISGIVSGSSFLWLLSGSGICFSVIYPALVITVTRVYPRQAASTAAGSIISIASLFDIGFNLSFGKMIDLAGYRISFLSMAICMLCFYLFYLILYRKVAASGTGKA